MTHIRDTLEILSMTWHWYRMQVLRRQGDRCLSRRLPLTSPTMLKLAERLDYHSARIRQLSDTYEARLVL